MQQVSGDERGQFQFGVGKALIQNLTERELNINILMVTNLLNAAECPEEDKLSTTKLNLSELQRYLCILIMYWRSFFEQCFHLIIFFNLFTLILEKRALAFSAFESCASFAEKAISLLPADKWTQHQCMTLELYSLCCKLHLNLGIIVIVCMSMVTRF